MRQIVMLAKMIAFSGLLSAKMIAFSGLAKMIRFSGRRSQRRINYELKDEHEDELIIN